MKVRVNERKLVKRRDRKSEREKGGGGDRETILKERERDRERGREIAKGRESRESGTKKQRGNIDRKK